MPQSLSKVYTHITFGTKNRVNYIDDEIESRLFDYLGGICKELKCNPIQIGGHKNHVHILCLLSKSITQSDFLKTLKKESSKWIKTIDEKYKSFYWQRGYGIFSVNPSEIEVVVKYIKNQKKHHSKRSFEDEFRAFLRKYEIEFDERFVWD